MAVKRARRQTNSVADLLTRVPADWLKCRGSSPQVVAAVAGAELPWTMADHAEGQLSDEVIEKLSAR